MTMEDARAFDPFTLVQSSAGKSTTKSFSTLFFSFAHRRRNSILVPRSLWLELWPSLRRVSRFVRRALDSYSWIPIIPSIEKRKKVHFILPGNWEKEKERSAERRRRRGTDTFLVENRVGSGRSFTSKTFPPSWSKGRLESGAFFLSTNPKWEDRSDDWIGRESWADYKRRVGGSWSKGSRMKIEERGTVDLTSAWSFLLSSSCRLCEWQDFWLWQFLPNLSE